ncbi:seryl-tRNA synthetase [Candidatus Phycorickettsia trachydisci]|uniref:Serine--tRNA ligase n=1 Tax=Candidatus Phycorickettsia trachydisci TaxID=2115978 RepID=A0A2P1P9C9_9RICK|nr:serine--tRNA ligase [Candidatus Phycorickettsia trachydisci]AVP87863.1 seryl-tRNA synthetase [Candidatus Phycorickettsia trachydisci]
MIDIKWIRQNPASLDENLAKRGQDSLSKEILDLDKKKRDLTLKIEQLQQKRNQTAANLSGFPDKKSSQFQKLKQDAAKIKQDLEALEKELENNKQLEDILDRLPNILNFDVPVGKDETENKLIKSWGNPKSGTLHHQDIGQTLDAMDFHSTAKMSGSRFVTLSGPLARLERALVNFLLDFHTSIGNFEEISPPYLVKHHAMYNAGILPKFSEDSFRVEEEFRLIPTAEVPLINLVADQIISPEELPMRLVAYTPCFRSEAGSAGADTKGLIRMHQFSKVELVSITTPDNSEEEHEFILAQAQKVLEKLELPYRTMLLCSRDTGFQSSKTYDIEVWLPSQKRYREISSCSNCKDFQARRMKARFKEFGQKETTFLHTLNGSGLPLGRTIAAILENYVEADGSVTVPTCLVNYMGGMKKISPKIKI